MIIKRYQIVFTTPAFLGNAEQSGQWRTPPFKHLLRQWWRVAYAADKNFTIDVCQLRDEEGRLFGNAWLENSFCKSMVRLRLSLWKEGSLRKWPSDQSVSHPEVATNGRVVGSSLYLGYGPLNFKGATSLKAGAAIEHGEEATLSVAFPAEHALRIERALWLMDRFGTLGGRSRNGWGSFRLIPTVKGQVPLRDWKACLDFDWPHAIGQDDKGPLIWQTAKTYDDWKTLMCDLAIIKIGLRTQFTFARGQNARRPEDRHWLSYPVTHHAVEGWGNLRLPNSLRFKVRRTDGDKLVGVIFHVPCQPPAGFQPDRDAIENVWQRVHNFLDERAQNLTRVPE